MAHSASRAVAFKVVAALVGVVALVLTLVASFSSGLSTPSRGAISLSAAGPAPAKAHPKPKSIAKPVNCRKVKCVALTFDDGPGPQTERLLAILRGAHTHATFFMLGIQVQKFPKTARDVLRNGHEIGDHTWDHKDLTAMSPQGVTMEIGQARTEIAHATGREPQLFRPPYGSTTDAVARLAGSLGMPEILWDVDTQDWLYRHKGDVQHNAVSAAFPGAIILMHDIYPSTIDAVPGIIKQLRAQGYTFVTVTQMFGHLKTGVPYFGRP